MEPWNKSACQTYQAHPRSPPLRRDPRPTTSATRGQNGCSIESSPPVLDLLARSLVCGTWLLLDMNASNDELEEQLEMLPTHSSPRMLGNTHTQSNRLGRSSGAWHRITLLLSTAGIVMVGYLFWPRMPPSSLSSLDPSTDTRVPTDNSTWLRRASSVKEAFQYAYGGYDKYTTFPDDELRPVSHSGQRKCVHLS
jgi:hypothetical protein